jgi:site-specific DNA-methyltransferase (adenine-specific)
MIQLIQGDCLTEMQKIESCSVDAIITDPPYGTTACKWDSVIPFEAMWEQLNRIIKPNGAIVLFGSEPFSSALRMSNIKNYKYDWYWKKNRKTNFLNARKMPMGQIETISLFFNKLGNTYNPIMQKRTSQKAGNKKYGKTKVYGKQSGDYKDNQSDYILPSHLIEINTERGFHPTQKPVALMEYLIKTYTNENETVLDFTMGSGTTGVAAKNLNRLFIGIEQDQNYFKIAKERINKPDLFTLDTK